MPAVLEELALVRRHVGWVLRRSTTRAVAVMAYALPDDRERFLSLGFDGYVSRPFSQRTLFDELSQLLR